MHDEYEFKKNNWTDFQFLSEENIDDDEKLGAFNSNLKKPLLTQEY
jgi:hypothetical protein